MSADARVRPHGAKQANLERAADNSGNVVPDRLDDQPLVDRERIEAARDEAAERSLGRRLFVGVDEDGIVLPGKAQDLLLADHIRSELESLPDGKIFGIQHWESPIELRLWRSGWHL